MKDLTKGNELKLIMHFALPMLIGSLFQQLYNTVDSIVVGQFVGKNALAAVGTAMPVIFLMSALMMGIGMGATILISQFYGAKDIENLKKTVATNYYVLIILGAVITFVGLILTNSILKLLVVPDEILEMAGDYLKIMFIGTLAIFGYNSISAVLRGLGDSKTPLYFLILTTFLNIFLDILFVAVFGFGVKGVAWATIISQLVSFISCMIFLNRTHDYLKLSLLKEKFSKKLFIGSLKIGIPSGVQQVTISLGMMAMQRLINSYGTVTMAAFNAASKVDIFCIMPLLSIGMAVSSFAGQNFGAGLVARVEKGNRQTLFMSWGLSVVISVLAISFGPFLITLFINKQDPDYHKIIQEGTAIIRIMCSFYFLFVVLQVLGGTLRGVGRATIPMVSSLLSMIFARVPVAYIISHFTQNSTAIWWSIPIGWACGTVLIVLYYRLGSWRNSKSLAHESA